MIIWIFSGGSIEGRAVEAERRQGAPDKVIAADRGLLFCEREHIRPDIIVGDFDSLGAVAHVPQNAETPSAKEQEEERKREQQAGLLLEKYRKLGVPLFRYPSEKDMTDTDIALERAVAAGADEVVFFGATGTRLDHTLSNIMNLYKLFLRGITGVIVDAHNRITVPAHSPAVLHKGRQYGNYVSLFPLNGPVENLTLRGFKYPLLDAELSEGDGGLGVSNEISSDSAEIVWTKGALIIMETRD